VWKLHPCIPLVLSVVAIAVAGVSAVYTKRQASSAARQAVEAEKVTAIEQKRPHADLEPVVALTCEASTRDGCSAWPSLTASGLSPRAVFSSRRWLGPAGLEPTTRGLRVHCSAIGSVLSLSVGVGLCGLQPGSLPRSAGR
jgi:hypothetical protein